MGTTVIHFFKNLYFYYLNTYFIVYLMLHLTFRLKCYSPNW